jgi:hypothetical protein
MERTIVEQPKYDHDCDRCQFLGTFDGHDLYYCPGGGPTIIARYSSDGPDYSSGMTFGEKPLTHEFACIHLRVAYLIAKDLGLRMKGC